MLWITHERPKVDRIACAWLIERFIDPSPRFLFVAADDVERLAQATGAIPFDVPNAELRAEGALCSFDAFLSRYALNEPALHHLARIVRGADTGNLESTPQSAGLQAISLGLSWSFLDDHKMLQQGFVIYDALYAWCRHRVGEELTQAEAV